MASFTPQYWKFLILLDQRQCASTFHLAWRCICLGKWGISWSLLVIIYSFIINVKWNTMQYNTTGSHEAMELKFIGSFQKVSLVKEGWSFVYSWYSRIIYFSDWWGLFILDMDGEFSNFFYFLRRDFFFKFKTRKCFLLIFKNSGNSKYNIKRSIMIAFSSLKNT